MDILIHLPEDAAHYAPEMQYFMQTMATKLYANRHKGWAEGLTYGAALASVEDELEEVRCADDQFSRYVECADVANMALLLGVMTLRQTVPEFQETNE